MFNIEPFYPEDIFNLNLVNLDPTTENYTFNYYLNYCLNFPNYNLKIKNKNIVGYIIGKNELKEVPSEHITALSVSSTYRNMKLATILMKYFEEIGNLNNLYFVDLFVRESNSVAINFYNKYGYVVYNRIKDYYQEPEEDAFDMRKSLNIDVNKDYMKPKC